MGRTGTPDCSIRLSITIEVRLLGNITVLAERYRREVLPGIRFGYRRCVPISITWPENTKVGFTVAIIITGNRFIIVKAKLCRRYGAVRAFQNIPECICRISSIDGKVGFAVAVIIALYRLVSGNAEWLVYYIPIR